jgi:hypothetical protein
MGLTAQIRAFIAATDMSVHRICRGNAQTRFPVLTTRNILQRVNGRKRAVCDKFQARRESRTNMRTSANREYYGTAAKTILLLKKGR